MIASMELWILRDIILEAQTPTLWDEMEWYRQSKSLLQYFSIKRSSLLEEREHSWSLTCSPVTVELNRNLPEWKYYRMMHATLKVKLQVTFSVNVMPKPATEFDIYCHSLPNSLIVSFPSILLTLKRTKDNFL